jgi:uncharacterized protein YjbI with pentapeptide repeats
MPRTGRQRGRIVGRPSVPRWTGFAGKTLWDWLELLVIPIALAAVGFGLNYFANERDQRREDRRAAQERAIAADGRREEVMRSYLQQMSSLMLERGLRDSRPGTEVQAVARTFTLTALRRLDPSRKAIIVRFLAQAGLIGSEFPELKFLTRIRVRATAQPPKVDLTDADLRQVPLRGADLSAKDLGGADLSGADLREARLYAARFDAADLRGADFRGAQLHLDPLIRGRHITFRGACVTGARFAGVSFGESEFWAGGRNVDLSRADLRDADLSFSTLIDANLEGANTSGTRLPPNWTDHGDNRNDAQERLDRICGS